MQAAVRRPHLTAGVALVGAGLIAVSTVSPVPNIHLSDVHLPSIRAIDVGLTAAVNPLDVYGKVIQDALANAGTLAENAKPGQVLAQILANQMGSAGALGEALQQAGGTIANALTTQVPALLQTALGQLSAGNVSGAVDSIIQIPLIIGLPAADLLPALGQLLTKPLQNLVNVVNTFTAPSIENLLLVSGLIAPLISAPAAAAAAVQNVLNAIGTGDPAAVVSALLTAPATVVDGLLNGGYGPDLGPLVTPGLVVKAGGLLSGAGLVFNEDGSFYVNTGGPIAALQQILQQIVTAITPPAPAAIQIASTDVAAIPAAAPATVNLATAPASLALAPAEGSTESSISQPSEQTPTEATEQTPDTVDAVTEPTEESSTVPDSTAVDSTEDTESDSATADSGTAQDSEDTAPKPAKGDSAGVKTGNKVEPKTTAGSASPSHEPGDTRSSVSTDAEKVVNETPAKGAKESAKSSDS